jgi:hypothetical protein
LPIYSDKNSSLKIGLVSNFLENNYFSGNVSNSRVDQLGLRYRTLYNSKENLAINNLDKLSLSYSKNLGDYSKISFLKFLIPTFFISSFKIKEELI